MQQKYQAQSELPDLVNSNSDDEFSFLYNLYEAALLGVIYKIVLQKTVAGEVLQQVFVKIQKQEPAYNPTSFSIFTWMLGIAIKTSLENVGDRESSIKLLKQEIRKHMESAAVKPSAMCTQIFYTPVNK
jgi:DNA-directed RNA polymerase specialized sigma24 family protein